MSSQEMDAVREYTSNVGQEHPDRQWILSPYDSWERNPYYSGPEQRHPEDDRTDEEYAEDEARSAQWQGENPSDDVCLAGNPKPANQLWCGQVGCVCGNEDAIPF